MSNINERSKNNFLTYANSVIKCRAIPSVEDNLKPIHRRILWSMYESKYFPDKKTVKSAKVVGNVMGSYHPHGDSSIYEALVRLSQWWKIRYPLVEFQGNGGNILGDTFAAARYTECKLSKIGMFMLEDINNNCVDFRDNFDNTLKEPVTLPSKFPYILCGNNSGIAVGMSSDLVSHNFTEVMQAIIYYLDHKDCSIKDLMQFIKGPDFPTGGFIANGDDLLDIYTTGRGSVRVFAHYDIVKKGQKTAIIFKDIPYGVEIDSGVKLPLKKLVLDDGVDIFENIIVTKSDGRNFNIEITLAKNANIQKALTILFEKTRLSDTIKINQTLIVNQEPKLFNLKELIAFWVNYRSNIIKKIATNDYQKTNHKLTITIGLQKCMSNIDAVIALIRNADNRNQAKVDLMKSFELNDEQADAILDMKLSRLSKLDLSELNNTEHDLKESLANLKKIIDDEQVRSAIIVDQLKEIKNVLGEDKRLTEILYKNDEDDSLKVEREFLIYDDGLHLEELNPSKNLVDMVFAYKQDDIYLYSKSGEFSNQNYDIVGAVVKSNKNKLVSLTKNGYIKVSNITDYRFKIGEKIMKVKEDDELVFASLCDDSDCIMLFSESENRVLKLSIKDLNVAGKITTGLKSGFNQISSAAVVKEDSMLLFITADNKAKLTPAKDFSIDSRGNKGQLVPESTKFMRFFNNHRESFYIVTKNAVQTITKSKVSIKSRTAIGATISSKNIEKVI